MDARLVGAGCQLGFRPKRLVVGYGRIQVLRLAHGFDGPLADPVGKAVTESRSAMKRGA